MLNMLHSILTVRFWNVRCQLWRANARTGSPQKT